MTLSRRALLSASALLIARPRAARADTPTEALIHPATDARADPLALCWNENPYGPGPAARAAMNAAVTQSFRYPDNDLPQLMDALAKKEGVSVDHLVTGTGSGELLCALGYLAARKGGEILFAEPTYLEMTDYAKRAGAALRAVPVDAAKRLDLKAMRAAVGASTRAVYVCNPNNPTGTAVPRAALREFAVSLPPEVTLIVDEAYMEFVEDPAVGSVADLATSGRRVVVLRTFSKIHGMAGVRCGYAITRPDIAAELAAARQTTPNIYAVRAAIASLGDAAFLSDTRRRIIASRQRVCRGLEALGLEYAQPHGNFVFFDTGMPLQDFTERMRARNILVARRFPPFNNWCRISIGREHDIDTFLAALRAVHDEVGRQRKPG